MQENETPQGQNEADSSAKEISTDIPDDFEALRTIAKNNNCDPIKLQRAIYSLENEYPELHRRTGTGVQHWHEGKRSFCIYARHLIPVILARYKEREKRERAISPAPKNWKTLPAITRELHEKRITESDYPERVKKYIDRILAEHPEFVGEEKDGGHAARYRITEGPLTGYTYMHYSGHIVSLLERILSAPRQARKTGMY